LRRGHTAQVQDGAAQLGVAAGGNAYSRCWRNIGASVKPPQIDRLGTLRWLQALMVLAVILTTLAPAIRAAVARVRAAQT
jgi:hypothetical protein